MVIEIIQIVHVNNSTQISHFTCWLLRAWHFTCAGYTEIRKKSKFTLFEIVKIRHKFIDLRFISHIKYVVQVF